MRSIAFALSALFLALPSEAAVTLVADVGADTPNGVGVREGKEALTTAEEVANGAGWKQFVAATRDDHPGFDDLGINQIGVVPELATWALMVSGFALAGIRLRRSPLRT